MSKSLLEKIESLEKLLRGMRKIESRIRQGTFIDAHREVCRIIAAIENNKRALLESEKTESVTEEAS